MNYHDTFFAVLGKAIGYFADNGFARPEDLTEWMEKIRRAAEASLSPPHVIMDALRDTYGTIYRRLIERGDILRFHDGVGRFTLQQVAPQLRVELDKAILANADLIKLNRKQAVDKTLQRFSGWATSVPPGGTPAESKAKVKADVRKALAQLPYVERRCVIDQGNKFASSLNRVVAEGGGAIAAKWRSHFRQLGYNARKDHKERDGRIYIIRDSWAHKQGLVKKGKYGYTDEITQPSQEINCRCFYVYIYSISKLPSDLLTEKGHAKLSEVKRE